MEFRKEQQLAKDRKGRDKRDVYPQEAVDRGRPTLDVFSRKYYIPRRILRPSCGAAAEEEEEEEEEVQEEKELVEEDSVEGFSVDGVSVSIRQGYADTLYPSQRGY
jgi:hypothetical protein